MFQTVTMRQQLERAKHKFAKKTARALIFCNIYDIIIITQKHLAEVFA